jgi:hypothetical protein
MNGDGWIPIPFSDYPIIALSQLPIDPINKPPYYYSFVAGGSYALYGQLENPKHPASKNDGDNYPHLYSSSFSNKRLIDQAQGLVGYWPFDEGSGTIAKDLSGNGNDATLYSGASACSNPPTTGCPQWMIGKVGYALNFDGIDDWAFSTTSIGLPTGASSRTLLAWIKPFSSAPGEWKDIIYWGTNTTTQLSDIGIPNGRFSFASYANDCLGIAQLTLGSWSFVVATYQNNILKLYLNSALDRFCTLSSLNTPSGTSIYIGVRHGRFQGLIDEIRIYNRALSDSEIKSLYDATK